MTDAPERGDPAEKPGARISSDLLWAVGWCVIVGGVSFLSASRSSLPTLRLLLFGLGALHLVVALGLYRLQEWARICGGALLFFGVLMNLDACRSGITMLRVFLLVTDLYWGIYLLQPSTRRLFATRAIGGFTFTGAISQSPYVLLFAACFALTHWLRLPSWTILLSLVPCFLYGIFCEDRVNRWLAARFAPPPGDLDRTEWVALRAAQVARLKGDLDEAERLAAPLPDSLTARTFRGLLAMDRALSSEGLARALYDYTWVAPPAARARVLEEVRASDVEALAAQRAALVDALLDEEARPDSVFLEETDERILRITGQLFLANPVFQHREAWVERRPLCTGERARTWLIVRLWDAQALEAAAEVAAGARDESMKDLALLSLRFDEIAAGRVNGEWVVANALLLCLAPGLADTMRLLYLDSPFLRHLGEEAVARRLTARVERIALLRRLIREYPADSCIEVPYLFSHLAGAVDRRRTRAALESRWLAQRDAQTAFDGSFVAGLDAARRGDWARAEREFADAQRAWPERTCAVFNRGLALFHLDRDREAEEVFVRLAQAEPEEAVFWMRAGDARRAQKRYASAIEAYRAAAKLGGLEDQVALRLGLTLASAGREEEAERELAAATADMTDPGRLEDLAEFLEAEGVYGLAARYREQALGRRLGEKPTGDEDEDGEAGPGVAG